MKRLPVTFGLLLLVLLAGTALLLGGARAGYARAPRAARPTDWNAFPVVTSPLAEQPAAIDGRYMVWADDRNHPLNDLDLYAFDLLESIYLEAWDDHLSPGSKTTGKCLRKDFLDVAALRREIPRLILEHNLHGIDIDSRAVQIAALALWMRAQRSWREVEFKPSERPLIVKTNVVCAEPMPGEEDMRLLGGPG